MRNLLFCLLILEAAGPLQAEDSVYQGKTVKEWIVLLKSNDARIRFQGVMALQEAREEAEPAVAILTKLLKDPYPLIRRGAASTLAGMGEAAAPAALGLARALGDSDPGVRQIAGQALKEMGEKAGPGLLEAMKDKEPAVRFLAISAVDSLGLQTSQTVEALGVAVKDGNPNVRRAALVALAKMGEAGKDALPAIAEALRVKDTPFRNAAALTILAMGKENAGPFVKALKDPNPEIRLTAAQALGSIGEDLDEAAANGLRAALADDDVRVRRSAILSLASMGSKARELGGGKEVLLGLTKLFLDKDATVRRAAAFALGKVGMDEKGDISRLAEGLKDKDIDVRTLTVQSLAQYSHEDVPMEFRHFVLGQVAEALKDKNRRVQLTAAQVLVGESAVAVPALLPILEKNTGQVRLLAVAILGEIGPAAADAVPALEQMTKKGLRDDRQAAKQALEKIQPRAGG